MSIDGFPSTLFYSVFLIIGHLTQVYLGKLADDRTWWTQEHFISLRKVVNLVRFFTVIEYYVFYPSLIQQNFDDFILTLIEECLN